LLKAQDLVQLRVKLVAESRVRADKADLAAECDAALE
jgi:hypothetical protein